MPVCCEGAPFCSPSQNGNSESNLNSVGNSRVVGRSDFLFIVGAIAIIAGLLFPLSAHIFDVLLIFSVSLTVGVLIITFSAQGILEVSGFPLLILLATMLRMALSVASAKLILSQGNAGSIIGFVGNIIVRNNGILAILIFGTFAVVMFRAICKAVKGISRTGTEFTADIVPIKQISIDGDLEAGVINNEQALDLREKIAREASFFIAMAGNARFILFCAVIELLIITVNIVASIAAGVVGRTSTAISVRTYMTSTIGAGMIIQISAFVTAAASRYLVRKSFAASGEDAVLPEPRRAGVERIEVVATEVLVPDNAELQDSNSVSSSEPAESQYIGSELTDIINPAGSAGTKANEMVIAEDLEWFAKPAAEKDEKDDLSLYLPESQKNSDFPGTAADSVNSNDEESAGRQTCSGDDYYGAIAESIESKSGVQVRTILMAAESVEELPVTIPVNIGMRLARKGQKCLLMDLDLERDAIAKVFDIDRDRVQSEAIGTCIDNLWVWPASNFGKVDGASKVTNIKDVITGLESQYDHVVVYAPNIRSPLDWEQIANCVQAAMLFGESPGPESEFESFSISDFHKLSKSYGCEILKPADVFAEAV